jgi:hypothetical protein
MNDWSRLSRSLTDDTVDSVDTVGPQPRSVSTVSTVSVSKTAGKDASVPFADFSSAANRRPLWSALVELERRRPEYVPVDRWRQCLSDGRRFLAEWASQAEAFGWSAKDIFGLLDVPEDVHPSFSRLSRYDAIGLCWLLDGGKVLAMTEATAWIETRTRARLRFYRDVRAR